MEGREMGFVKPQETDPEAGAREFGFESAQAFTTFLTQMYVERPGERKERLAAHARDAGMELEVLTEKLRAYKVEKLRTTEGPHIRFYHRTDLEAFRQIILSGALLSPEKIQERNPDGEKPVRSPRHHVMFTRDTFHEGKLWRPGFSAEEARKSATNAVVFVFKDALMDQPDFDPLGDYPEAEEAPLSLCEGVLVMRPEDLPRVKQILQDAGYNTLPVKLASEWRKPEGEKK